MWGFLIGTLIGLGVCIAIEIMACNRSILV